MISAAGRNKGFKQLTRYRIRQTVPLGVPLHAQGERVITYADGFHQIVRCTGFNGQFGAKPFGTLTM